MTYSRPPLCLILCPTQFTAGKSQNKSPVVIRERAQQNFNVQCTFVTSFLVTSVHSFARCSPISSSLLGGCLQTTVMKSGAEYM